MATSGEGAGSPPGEAVGEDWPGTWGGLGYFACQIDQIEGTRRMTFLRPTWVGSRSSVATMA